MKYCVLGAGLMGKAIAYDLLQYGNAEKIIIVDQDKNQITRAIEFLNNTCCRDAVNRVSTKIFNANNILEIENLFSDVDAAIAAIYYGFNVAFSRIAIKTKTHLCDLGGNSAVVDEQLKLHKEAEKAGVSIIPDCGLAPGMVAVLVKWGIEKFNWADTVKIRVGGLPVSPKNKLKYERLFSVDGLVNEYIEPVRVLRNGKIEIIEPLTEIEEINFAGAFHGTSLQAFTTSGGTSTLIETYKDRLKNLDYKTIRYAGHCEEIKKLQKEGLFSHEYFEKNLPLCTDDVTLVKIIFMGGANIHEIEIIDRAKPPFTSMMRMTAFPAAIISQMQAKNEIKKYGVLPQERCVPVDLFIKELKKREINISGI